MTELKPCPFCNKPAYVSEPDSPSLGYEIGCPDNWNFKRGSDGHCGVAPAATGMEYAETADAWNRRPSPSISEGEVEAALNAKPNGGMTVAEFLVRAGIIGDGAPEHIIRSIILAASKARATTEVEVGWWTMDSVPKDGREVLLLVKSRGGTPYCQLVGHWMVGGHCIEDHPPIEAGWYFWSGSAFDKASEPLFWQPLAALPNATRIRTALAGGE